MHISLEVLPGQAGSHRQAVNTAIIHPLQHLAGITVTAGMISLMSDKKVGPTQDSTTGRRQLQFGGAHSWDAPGAIQPSKRGIRVAVSFFPSSL